MDNNKSVPLWYNVLNQEKCFSGNCTFNFQRIALHDALQLCTDMIDNCGFMEDIFYVSLFPEANGSTSGNIQQCLGKGVDDKVWITFQEVLL